MRKETILLYKMSSSFVQSRSSSFHLGIMKNYSLVRIVHVINVNLTVQDGTKMGVGLIFYQSKTRTFFSLQKQMKRPIPKLMIIINTIFRINH